MRASAAMIWGSQIPKKTVKCQGSKRAKIFECVSLGDWFRSFDICISEKYMPCQLNAPSEKRKLCGQQFKYAVQRCGLHVTLAIHTTRGVHGEDIRSKILYIYTNCFNKVRSLNQFWFIVNRSRCMLSICAHERRYAFRIRHIMLPEG